MTPEADRYEVILYGSLAKTGVGHGTDRVLVDTLAPYPAKIVFASVDPGNMKHPNTLDLIAYKDNKETQRIRVESIGGGDIVVEGEAQHADADISRKFLCRDRALLSVAARVAAGVCRAERGARRSGASSSISGMSCASRSRTGSPPRASCPAG